jgi:hypothetical protein
MMTAKKIQGCAFIFLTPKKLAGKNKANENVAPHLVGNQTCYRKAVIIGSLGDIVRQLSESEGRKFQ